MQRVLITSVSAGSGHVRAAEALQAAAQRCFPDTKAHHIDVLNYVTRPFKLLYSGGYSFAVDRAPFLWKKIYGMTDNQAAEKKVQPALNMIQRRYAKEFLDYVQHFNPDLIITTHFLVPQLLEEDIRLGRVTPRLECVITDYDLHQMWIHEAVQKYYVAHEGIADKLVAHGVSWSKIQVSGIPIHPSFSESVSKPDILRDLVLEPHLPTVLLLSGGSGLRSLERTLQELIQVYHPVQIVTVSGNNPRLRERLGKVKLPAYVRLRNLGYVSNMHELLSVADLAITKAGGLTVSECLAKQVPMIMYSPIPGQEERNAAYLERIGAGTLAENPAELKMKYKILLENKSELWAMKNQAEQFGTPQAAYRVVTSVIHPLLSPIA